MVTVDRAHTEIFGRPDIQVLTPQRLTEMATPLAIEKSRIPPGATGSSMENIAGRLHLDPYLPEVQAALAAIGITMPPTASDRRKADTLTLITASLVIEQERGSPESIKATAINLASQMPTEMFLRSIRETSRREDSNLGQKNDLTAADRRIGFLLRKGMETGQIDRLLGACVITISRDSELPPSIALDLTQAIVLNRVPQTVQAAALVPRTRMLFEVAQAVRERIPRVGLKAGDVPYTPIAETASRLIEQAEQLKNPSQRELMVRRLIEQGTVPPKISRLSDVLSIVDHSPEIQAVSFDIYDTLVQWTSDQTERREHHAHRAYIALSQAHVTVSEQDFRQIMDSAWQKRWNDFQAIGIEVPIEVTMDAVVTDLEKRGCLPKSKSPIQEQRDDISKRLTQLWYDVELETAVVMPEAVQTLEELKKRGLKVCVTSNASWSRRHIYRVLHRFGLEKYIDAVTISSEDTAKPRDLAEQEAYLDYNPSRRIVTPTRRMKKPNQTEFFHYAWDKLGVPYSSILHIGDNPWDDFQGGSNAGGFSSQYDNPLGYRRLEQDAKFRNDHALYATTALAMEKEALDEAFPLWLRSEMQHMHVPAQEQERVGRMAREIYRRSRDIFAPAYIATAEIGLQQLQNGGVDQVLCLARDGLPLSVTGKLLLHFEHDRFPDVTADQIRYIHTSRSLLEKVSGVNKPLDQELRNRYLRYLQERGILQPGKRTLLTDLLCGSGLTHNLLANLLRENGQTVTGIYLESHQPHIDGFLQQATGENHPFLTTNSMLLFFEALLNGPNRTVKNYDVVETTSGSYIIPKGEKKQPTANVLTRGLSRESVIFFNQVAVKGLIDGVRMHNRRRLAGIAPESPLHIAQRFINFLVHTPTDDIRRSIPWEDHGQWFLPSQNQLETNL